MENYYRGKSRAIAIIDIIWSSVGLGSTILTFFGLALLSQAERNDYKRTQNFNPELAGGEPAAAGPNDEIYFRPNNQKPSDGVGGGVLQRQTVRYNEVSMVANVMLGVVMLAMAINTIQLIAAIRLLKACDVEMETHKSIKSCRFWCCITIFFVVILGLHLFTPGRVSLPGQIFSMAQILFRALGLYYVSEFIKELAHGQILPINIGHGHGGIGVGGGGVGGVAASAISFSQHHHNHPLNLHNHSNPIQGSRLNFFPKPPGFPPGEEPPPPYCVSEAPPPYEHVGKI